MSENPPRMLPLVDNENSYFWESGQTGQLKILRCQDCGHYIHEYSPLCLQCKGQNTQPETVSGKATVVSFTVNYQPWLPNMQVPYIYAIVELEEQKGLRLITNIINCEPDAIAIGDSVKVAFHHYDDVWVPVFEKA